MVKKYRVLFHYPLVESDDFRAGMARIGVPGETVSRMIAKAPVVLKGGLTPEEARLYADAVQGAGGRVTIDEDGSFESPFEPKSSSPITAFRDFTMCPRCGFKQQRGERCIKCGNRFAGGGDNQRGE